MPSFPEPLVVIVTEASWGSALHALSSAKHVGASTMAVTVGTTARVLAASRHCDRAVELPDGDAVAIGASMSDVVDGCQWPGPVVVIPLADRLAGAIDLARHRFGENTFLAVPDHPTLVRLLRKSSAFEDAMACGLSVPDFCHVADDAGVEAALQLRRPVVVRADSALDPAGDCRKAEVYSQRDALSRRLTDLVARGAMVIAQTQVTAPERAVEFGMCWRSRDGSHLTTCTGRKNRQSHRDGGVMVWGETEPLADVDALTRRFVEHVGFSGVGGAEFIRAADGLWFIEFNPRPESIHFLATAAGVDLLGAEIEHLASGALPTSRGQRPAAGWVGSAALARARAEPTMVPHLLVDRVKFATSRPHVRAIVDRHDLGPAREIARLMLRNAWGAERPT